MLRRAFSLIAWPAISVRPPNLSMRRSSWCRALRKASIQICRPYNGVGRIPLPMRPGFPPILVKHGVFTTDEEWVFAARSHFHDDALLVAASRDPSFRWLARYEKESEQEALDQRPRPAGAFGANEYGLLDLSGNGRTPALFGNRLMQRVRPLALRPPIVGASRRSRTPHLRDELRSRREMGWLRRRQAAG